jgi:hypothetical protein
LIIHDILNFIVIIPIVFFKIQKYKKNDCTQQAIFRISKWSFGRSCTIQSAGGETGGGGSVNSPLRDVTLDNVPMFSKTAAKILFLCIV